MKEHITKGGRDRDCDRQLLYDRDLGQGTRHGGCRGIGHEDRAQDKVCLGTGGPSVGLSWWAVAGQGAVVMPVVGGCHNTRVTNEISKRALCVAWEFSRWCTCWKAHVQCTASSVSLLSLPDWALFPFFGVATLETLENCLSCGVIRP